MCWNYISRSPPHSHVEQTGLEIAAVVKKEGRYFSVGYVTAAAATRTKRSSASLPVHHGAATKRGNRRGGRFTVVQPLACERTTARSVRFTWRLLSIHHRIAVTPGIAALRASAQQRRRRRRQRQFQAAAFRRGAWRHHDRQKRGPNSKTVRRLPVDGRPQNRLSDGEGR